MKGSNKYDIFKDFNVYCVLSYIVTIHSNQFQEMKNQSNIYIISGIVKQRLFLKCQRFISQESFDVFLAGKQEHSHTLPAVLTGQIIQLLFCQNPITRF